MFEDPFANSTDSLMAPASDCFAIAPSDSADLPRGTKALYVGMGGDITLLAVEGDSDVTLRNVIGGSILDLRVRAIRATGTTASDIVGLA